MAKKAQVAAPEMSDAAVKLKTGKTWAQWFAVLDKSGAAELGHRAIADLLFEKFDVGPWWCQMVTVEYERARGLREKYQSAGSYRVSVSKTIPCDLSALFQAAADIRFRRQWFPKGKFEPSTATRNKYLRGSWKGISRIELGFYAKADGRSQIAVEVNKLAGPNEVESVRAVWKKALARLSALLTQ